MAVRWRRAVLLLPCVAAWAGWFTGHSSSGHTKTAGVGADEAAIRSAIVETAEAFNSHNASAVARFYTTDADLVTVRGEAMKGSAEIERGLARLFATRNKEALLSTRDVTIRFVRPDVALVHVTNEISQVVEAGGRRLPPQRELSLRVFVKDGGVWRVTALHNTLVGGQSAAVSDHAGDDREALDGASPPSNKQLQRTRPAQATEPRR